MSKILTRKEFEAQFHRMNGPAAEEALLDHDAAQREQIARLREALEKAPHEDGCHMKRSIAFRVSLRACSCWKSRIAREAGEGGE